MSLQCSDHGTVVRELAGPVGDALQAPIRSSPNSLKKKELSQSSLKKKRSSPNSPPHSHPARQAGVMPDGDAKVRSATTSAAPQGPPPPSHHGRSSRRRHAESEYPTPPAGGAAPTVVPRRRATRPCEVREILAVRCSYLLIGAGACDTSMTHRPGLGCDFIHFLLGNLSCVSLA